MAQKQSSSHGTLVAPTLVSTEQTEPGRPRRVGVWAVRLASGRGRSDKSKERWTASSEIDFPIDHGTERLDPDTILGV